MSEQRALTRDTRLAAALGSLGIPIEIRKSLDSTTGKVIYFYYLSLRSVCGRHDTRRIKHQIRSGKLEKIDPAHEALTALRAMHNRERRLDLLNKGTFMQLVRVPGTQLWQSVPGDTGLPGRAG